MQSRFDTIVQAGYTVEIPITVHSGGTLHYAVNAEEKVDSLLLDLISREAYRRGERTMPALENNQEHLVVGEVPLHRGGQWFFIVRNTNNRPVRVQISLEFRPMSLPTGPLGGIFR